MPESTSLAIYSVYVAMVYLLAMPRRLVRRPGVGPAQDVAIAAGVIMCGHLLLALPGTRPTSSRWHWWRSARVC
ncbi:hypothetical protein GCM10020221_02560 [Streptomyces thioluteus]|uniref:Uncharacterized protein n=1 Tax=Streptomyces thioluteus TaxID=66431 RepID=A0ABN3WD45_STRTU